MGLELIKINIYVWFFLSTSMLMCVLIWCERYKINNVSSFVKRVIKITIWILPLWILINGVVPVAIDTARNDLCTEEMLFVSSSAFPPGAFFLDQRLLTANGYYHLVLHSKPISINKRYKVVFMRNAKFILSIELAGGDVEKGGDEAIH